MTRIRFVIKRKTDEKYAVRSRNFHFEWSEDLQASEIFNTKREAFTDLYWGYMNAYGSNLRDVNDYEIVEVIAVLTEDILA